MSAVAQPSGRVTFVFTDIEGSTALLESLGPAVYRHALAEHRDVVRSAFGRHAGYEVNYEGDGFFYAFSSARDAVAAVRDAMRALEGGPIRVRVGVHTGRATLDPPKYVGMDVHRTARIMAAAHGGQAVLSRATAELLPDGFVDLVDLGVHRLKDMAAAERLYQVDTDELSRAFPPLRSLYRASLPVPPTPFRGRTSELARTVRMLTDPTTGLLTLTGPGGVGKTRLALQAAADVTDAYADGVGWVPLAPVSDPVEVPRALARALEIPETPARPIDEQIVRALADSSRLLVLDNCEHVLDAAAQLARNVLEQCPGVTILATTREPLALRHERVLRVPPLPSQEAQALFVERARAARDDFGPDEHVHAICEALEGLPLAIELAAAHVRTLSPGAILERLGARLLLLKADRRDGDERHRSLEDTIRWSYDLLSPEQQRVLRGLGVFVGGCTLDALLAVCQTELHVLESLVDKSLVYGVIDEAGQDRYWMLESIRQYASEKLDEAQETSDTAALHRAYYVELARQLEPLRFGLSSEEECALFDADRANFQAALGAAISDGDGTSALKLVRSLAWLWFAAGDIAPLHEAGTAATAMTGGDRVDRALAQARLMFVAYELGDAERARSWFDASEPVLEAAGELTALCDLLRLDGFAAAQRGDPVRGVTACERALAIARTAGDRDLEVAIEGTLAVVVTQLALSTPEPDRGLLRRARSLYESTVAWSRNNGMPFELATALLNGSFTEHLLGDHVAAVHMAQDALRVSPSFTVRFGWAAVGTLSYAAVALGHHREGIALLHAAMAEAPRQGSFIEAVDEQVMIPAARSAARAALGDEAYEAAVREGEAMPPDEMIELALRLCAAD